MKKYIVFALGILAMLLASCGNQSNKDDSIQSRGLSKAMIVGDEEIDAQDIDDNGLTADALLLVSSSEEETKPYVRWLWTKEWIGNNWLYSDAIPFAEEVSRYSNEIPEIVYTGDFSVSYKEGVSSLSSISVYHVEAPYDRIQKYTDISMLEELPEGNYYIGIAVQEQGKFIESENEYEAKGYECIYWMVK